METIDLDMSLTYYKTRVDGMTWIGCKVSSDGTIHPKVLYMIPQTGEERVGEAYYLLETANVEEGMCLFKMEDGDEVIIKSKDRLSRILEGSDVKVPIRVWDLLRSQPHWDSF